MAETYLVKRVDKSAGGIAAAVVLTVLALLAFNSSNGWSGYYRTTFGTAGLSYVGEAHQHDTDCAQFATGAVRHLLERSACLAMERQVIGVKDSAGIDIDVSIIWIDLRDHESAGALAKLYAAGDIAPVETRDLPLRYPHFDAGLLSATWPNDQVILVEAVGPGSARETVAAAARIGLTLDRPY
jgi:hypothetical protein